MKRWMGWLMAGMLVVSPMSLQGAEISKGPEPLAMDAPERIASMVPVENLPETGNVFSEGQGILKDGARGGNWIYHSPSGNEARGIVGLLTVQKKDIAGNALLVHTSLFGEEGALAATLFDEGGMPPETAKRVFAFNLGLLRSESAINEVLMETMEQVRQETKERIPYSLISVDFLQVDQLQRNKKYPYMYNASLRAVMSADGWAVPFFIRMTVIRAKDTPKLLVLLTRDSEKNLFIPVMDEMAKDIALGNL
ncbi:MAG: hypothetical protein SPI25_02965 [Dialister sp.]|nr:hypothetical protein [Dialister sp.]